MARMELYDDPDFDLPAPDISREEFLAWRAPRYGTQHPTDFSNPLWAWLVRSRLYAYTANQRFKGPNSFTAGPMWCFHRFGTSRTVLPDGRTVYVAGEHEDYYDPDFYIYNDVIVQHPDGSLTILGYPRDDFPPTDFHSATLVGDRLVLIGNLGYLDDRRPGETPVLELDLSTFEVRRVRTHGAGPGWISRHTARFDADTRQVVIQGGEVYTGPDQPMVASTDEWALDVSTWRWQRRTLHEWPQFWFTRADRQRNHLWHLRQLAWYLSVNWEKDVNDERARLMEGLGFVPDAVLLERLYLPWPDAEALPVDEDAFGIHETRVDGAVVRFDESDGFGVRVVVQGRLAGERIEALKQGLINTLRAIEGVDWEATTLAGESA